MSGLLDIVKKGSTDRSVCIRIIDSTDGTPETGVVFNTSGIDLWYRREGAAVSSITEATLAALTTAHSDGGFLHVSHGYYRLDLPDAAFATGANYVDIGGTVTGMVVIGGRVRLVDYDPEDTVRLGLTALPNNTRLALAYTAVIPGTVDNTAFTATATVFESDDITEATADHYIGRSVYPTSGALVGNCIGVVTDYALTSGRGRFTISPGSPTGEAMADNVTFILI